jgi:hypothetical protein
MNDDDAVHTREGIFRGPGLLRKPRIGETLISRRTGEKLVVDHFDATNEKLLHYRTENGWTGCFIWSFADCLNRLIRHEDESYPA